MLSNDLNCKVVVGFESVEERVYDLASQNFSVLHPEYEQSAIVLLSSGTPN